MKNISCTSRKLLNDLLDIPTQGLNSTELKLLEKCRIIKRHSYNFIQAGIA